MDVNKEQFPYKLERPNRLCQKLLIVDGIGSSGKGMLSHLLASISNVEKQSNHTVFDFIPYFHGLGKISEDAAITHLQIEADMQMYHIRMSRDVNFRPKDSTGVLQNPHPFRYIKRLFQKEGDGVVKDILERPTWLNEAPHDAMRNAKLFELAFSHTMHFVYIARDPEDLAIDWLRRGFGRRIGNDPREFQLTYVSEKAHFPVFAEGFEGVYHSLTELEKVALFISYCTQQNLLGLKRVARNWNSSSFTITTFENLVRNPENLVKRVATKLNEAVDLRVLYRRLQKENVPRIYNPHKFSAPSEFAKERLAEAHDAHHELLGIASEIDPNSNS